MSDFVKDTIIRAVKTMAQTALSMLTIGQAVIDVNWQQWQVYTQS